MTAIEIMGVGIQGPRGIGLGVSLTDFGAIGDGVTDDTAAIQAAVDFVLGGNAAAGAANTRTPTKPIYAPKGTYKVTSKIKIYSALGFKLYGDGDSTQFAASGTLDYVFDIDGLYYSEFSNFSVIGLTVADIATNAIGLNNTANALFTCTGTKFTSVIIRNLKFVRGFSLGESSTSSQVDQVSLYHCKVAGQWTDGETTYWQDGVSSGSGTNGNILNHHLYSCVITGNANNVHANACQVFCHGITVGNGGVDFLQTGSRAISVDGCRSETSQRLFDQGGGSSISVNASLKNITWQSDGIHSDKRFIKVQYAGAVNISNLDTGLSEAAPVIYVANSSTRSAQITVDGILTRQDLASLFVSAGGTSPATITVRGYTQINTSSQELTNVPFYTKNLQTYTATELPTFSDGYVIGSVLSLAGTGTPEGSATAPVGSTYRRTDGGTRTSFYVKESGSGNTGWVATNAANPDIQWFTTPGANTWTRPAGAKTVEVMVIPGGAGGGSGRRGAAGSVRCGGGGGGAGWVTRRSFDASEVGSSVTVTVGAGGAGGIGQTVNDTNGNAGSAGTASSFGTLCSAAGAGGGQGGTATAGTGGSNPPGITASTAVGSGATASASGGAGVGANGNLMGAGSGASGGGITTGDAASNGGAGGGSYLGSLTGGGTAGVVDSTAAGSGTASTLKGTPGPGGGGGASSITTAAQTGAAAANYGGGGGGGGASLNGNNSGNGGNGAPGGVLVITFF